MSVLTVRDLAKVVGTPVDKLILQFNEAGVSIEQAEQAVDDQAKQALLAYLRRNQGTLESEKTVSPQRITVTRKSVSQIKVTTPKGGRSTAVNVVNVEVRKKRTYVKRKPQEETSAQLESAAVIKSEDIEETFQAEAPPVVALKDSKEESLIAEKEATESVKPVLSEAIQPVETSSREDFELEVSEKQKLSPEETQKENEENLRREQEELERRKTENKFKRKLKARARREADEEELAEEDLPRALLAVKHPLARRIDADDVSRRGKRKLGNKESDAKANLFAISRHGFERPTAPVIKEVMIMETATVAELAQKMSVKGAEVIRALMKMGVMATINQVIDQDTAILVIEEMGHKAKLLKSNALEEALLDDSKGSTPLVTRAPVVAIMGHVDHGKTSLLDYIRRTKVTAGEAGGITQHIGAYRVHIDKGDITFLDTPGHAAFTAMRARGAKCTDIVVLVVAADDGVMPQTEEAIMHAKAAKVPIVVAVNKMDKPDADFDRVKQELSTRNVLPEEWGGDSLFVAVSAKTGLGVDTLLESILLQAEMADLKAEIEGPAKGVVIESRLDKGRGPVATVLVQNGRLKKGDILLAGTEYGRIRALMDARGEQLDVAGPSVPVEVLGLSGVPNAGDAAFVVDDERKAREIVQLRQTKVREAQLIRQATTTENLFSQMVSAENKALNIVLKADVHGSVEAISDALSRLSSDEVKVSVISQGVGGITESDIHLAKTSKALVIGFNVRAEAPARRLAEIEGIPLYYYSIIYDVIEQVGKAARGLMSPKIKEVILGTAEVRNVFRSSKLGAIAGCMVTEGNIKRGRPIRVLRNNVVIYEGELESLRRFKDDVSEVRNGMECGIGVKNYNDVSSGDQIEVYERVEVTEG